MTTTTNSLTSDESFTSYTRSYSPFVSVLTRRTQDLSVDELEAVYRVWKLHVATQYSITDFKKKLVDTFQTVFLFYDTINESIRGCLFGSVYRNQVFQGKTITIAQPGIGYLEENFRPVASPVYNQVHMDFYMKELLINPCIPVYICGRALTYKGYVASMRFKSSGDGCLPRYNKEEIPAFEKSLLDDYGRRICGELYDPVTGVTRKEEVGVKDGVADIKERHLSNPHVRFFLERNPDWKKGHMLCVIGKVTWRTALDYLAKRKHIFPSHL